MTVPDDEPGFLDLAWGIPLIAATIVWAACESVAQTVRKIRGWGR
jgi:hypothetical protein